MDKIKRNVASALNGTREEIKGSISGIPPPPPKKNDDKPDIHGDTPSGPTQVQNLPYDQGGDTIPERASDSTKPRGSQQPYGPASQQAGQSSLLQPPMRVQPSPDNIDSQRGKGRRYSFGQKSHGSRSEREDLYSKNEYLVDKLRRRDRTIQDREHEIEQLQQHLGRGEQDRRKLEEELRSFQEGSFKSLEDTKWVPMDDASITHDLVALQDNISRLAKTYALENLKHSRADMLALQTTLSAFTHLESDDDQAFVDFMNLRHAPRLCLTALLSHAIFKETFQNPFFFMGDGFEERLQKLSPESLEMIDVAERPSVAVALRLLYRAACRYSAREANLWRSQTLRLLNPPEVEGNEAVKDVLDNTTTSAWENCGRAVRRFESGASRLLLRDMEAAMREPYSKGLVALFEDAGKLSIRLWTQRPELRCVFLTGLERKGFRIDSPVMQAHGVHKLDDPDDHSLDGKELRMVVHPAVLGLGTHDAEHYELERVWVKAVVWLDV